MNRDVLVELIEHIPRVGEYHQREKRREIDRRLREAWCEALEQVRYRLGDLQKELTHLEGSAEWMDELERIHGLLVGLIDEIAATPDSYRAFFDLETIDHEHLERLREFDRKFALETLQLRDQVHHLHEAMFQSPQAFRQALSQLMSILTQLIETYQQRKDLVRHVQTRLPKTGEV